MSNYLINYPWSGTDANKTENPSKTQTLLSLKSLSDSLYNLSWIKLKGLWDIHAELVIGQGLETKQHSVRIGFSKQVWSIHSPRLMDFMASQKGYTW